MIKLKMPVIYVAGPFRAATPWLIEKNVRRAEEVSLSLWQMGAAALCPHANTRFFQNSAPDEVWIEGTMELLRRCDAVVLVGPVAAREASSGTAAEVSEARRLNMPIFDSEDLHAEFRIKHWITEFVREMNP